MRIFTMAWVLILLVVSSTPLVALENPSLVHVYLMNKTDYEILKSMPLDIPYITENYAEVVAYADDIEDFNAAGLHYDIVHEDLVAFYQSRNPVNTTMGGFLTYPEIVDSLDALHASFPNMVSEKFSIGLSWGDRDLWAIKISDNVNSDEDETEIFFNSLIHAREPASMSWLMNFITWLLDNYGTDPDATDIIEQRELWFLPVINPDGYEYNRQTYPNGGGMWRKNRRSGGGVDLNRNWGFMWGHDDVGSSPYPSDETYRGPEAFSEPETQALRDFIISRDFKFIVNAHTYGNWFLYPYGYENIYTPDHDIFVALGDSVQALNGYVPGTAWENLYPVNGDANDWQYGEQDVKPLIFCATPETGSWQDGFWPSVYRIPQLNAEMLPVGIYLAKVASNLRAISPPVAPVLDPIGEVDTTAFTVTWSHDDEYNPAVSYELIEKSGFTRISDNFESGSDNWNLGGFMVTTSRYHSPNHSLFSGNQNNYNGQAVISEDLSVQAGDTLGFWTFYDIEVNYDYAYVEISTDGGNSFTPIAGSITTNYNPNGRNRGNGITGSSYNQWIHAFFPLDDYIGSTVKVKFSYITDGYLLGSGMYIDDVSPIETFENEIVLSSDITETSYLIEGRENGTYFYQVRARDAEDQWSGYSNREEAVVDVYVSLDQPSGIPYEFDLAQNYPNPFNASTEIAFTLSTPGLVKLEVFDIAGKLVRVLLDKTLESGAHSIIWDGRNTNSETVSTGIYFYKLTAGNKAQVRSMTLLK